MASAPLPPLLPLAMGPIRKMKAAPGDPGTPGAPVRYHLPVGDGAIAMNPLLGRRVRFKHTGRIFCIHCGKATRTSFSQGYCFTCMQSLAQCDMCIVRPETCHHHLGTCREPAWGEAHCFIDHTVYLANSSGLKVGITRSHQMETRWMDQGAIQALPIVRVGNRRDSGLVETALAKVVPDKTNWRLMLKGDGERVDLKARRDALFDHLAGLGTALPGERLFGEEVRFSYPVIRYPEKAVSLNLDKVPEVAGELLGVKGQYLILDVGVINMRKYAGYELEWQADRVPEASGAEDGPGAETQNSQAAAVASAFPPAPDLPAPRVKDTGQTSLFQA